MDIEIKGERLKLLAEKAIYWPSQKSLLLSDLHLGKTNHLRKNGYALSNQSKFETLEVLDRLLSMLDLEQVVILGDLFHSSLNQEWHPFAQLRQKHAAKAFILVLGNHDIIPVELYHEIDVQTHEQYSMGPFLLTHEPLDDSSHPYNIYGHIHPSVLLRGKGRMRKRLACFYIDETYCILPAFGSLTGLARLKLKHEAEVYAINFPTVFKV